MNSNTYLTSYQRMEGNDFDEEIPPDPLVHVVPKSNKTRWNHIEDLDSFFDRIYKYHQCNGFCCMMTKEVGDIIKYNFTIYFTIFLFTAIDYNILFKNKLPPGFDDHNKVVISDCLLSPEEAWRNMSTTICFFFILSILFLFFKLGHFVVNFFHFKYIKKFYNEALSIDDSNLENLTWEEVQRRIMEVQIEQRMCIHKETLTELDIYHRILRYENYFIAMANKNVIPLKLNIPFLGEVVFLSRGLRFNLNLILFTYQSIAAFKNWHLKDEYKRFENRLKLSETMRRIFFWFGVINLVFAPFILFLQGLQSFFHHTYSFRSDPAALGMRRWSNYGKVLLRHYNELDHELKARLSRGYRFANQYMNSFSSPLVAHIANTISYVTGAILAVLLVLTIYDEDVIQVEHLITVMSVLAACTAICRSLVPNENQVWCPEVLMTKILSEVHYLPDSWKGRAHTTYVRKEFSKLFPLNSYYLLECILSPLLTPYLLIFKMPGKSIDIVDFLRNFTVEVPGVGDICSFAQMDIGKHGSATWRPNMSFIECTAESEYSPPNITDNGKTELSLLHFTLTNPRWKPPQESAAFLNAVKEEACEEFKGFPLIEPQIFSSLSPGSLGGISPRNNAHLWFDNMIESVGGNVNRKEGPVQGPTNGVVGSLSRINPKVERDRLSVRPLSPMDCDRNNPVQPQDMVAYDLSVSTLYLHQIHQRRLHAVNFTDNVAGGSPFYRDSLNIGPRLNEELYPVQGNIAESYYNSSDPPSVDESIDASRNLFPNISPPRRNFEESTQVEVEPNNCSSNSHET